MMLPVPQFYAQSRWRDRWNVLRPNGTRHRGHDIACATHEDIPLLRAGTLVENDHSGALGNYAVVQVGAAFDFYCHLLIGTRPNVDDRLPQGARIGQAAGPNDDHGSSWYGVHLHYGSGPKVTSVTSGTTYDATAIIRSTLTSFAGGGITPIGDHPATNLRKRAMTRFVVRFIDVNNYYVFDTAPHLPNVSARYSQLTNIDEVNRMREIMPYIEYPNQGDFDRDRIKARLGDTATLVPGGTETGGVTVADIKVALEPYFAAIPPAVIAEGKKLGN